MLLPKIAMIKLNLDTENPSYVLVHFSFTQKPNSTYIWETELCTYPLKYLDHGILKEDAIDIPSNTYTFLKQSKEYITTMYRKKRYILKKSECIPEYIMSNPYTILPNEVYNYVYSKKDINKIYHFTLNDILHLRRNTQEFPIQYIQQKPEVRIKTEYIDRKIYVHTGIPKHIFRMVVELAESKKEECPITMEPIEKKRVGGTPCGHLFDKEALVKVLKDTQKCPTCRERARPEDIQMYE
jgi:hypothetical protein